MRNGSIIRVCHIIVMGDENERKRMSVKAIEVRERYSQESVLRAWDGLFESVGAKV